MGQYEQASGGGDCWWSGRGHQPAWVKAHRDTGAQLKDLIACCLEPEVRAIVQRALREFRVQRGHQNHRVASVALVRKFASEQAENSSELPNCGTGILTHEGFHEFYRAGTCIRDLRDI